MFMKLKFPVTASLTGAVKMQGRYVILRTLNETDRFADNAAASPQLDRR
jgi:hypothetical protein